MKSYFIILINGNDVVWDLGIVEVGESITIFFTDFVSKTANVGDIVNFPVSIESNETELMLANNDDVDVQPLVGGFDPNDILVYPEGYIDNHQELTYTIRFQNVGNIPASNIFVENQLPENLDIDQFQMGIASHNYRLNITEDNKLVWTFENINLPDSVNNEADSHGFILYKIKPKQNLEDGALVHNSAKIYFDNNLPIQTNTVYNTIGEEPETTIAKNGGLQIYPNPTFGRVTFEIASYIEEKVKIKSFFIHDLAGGLILSKESILDEKINIEEGILVPGFYEVLLIGDDRQEYRGKLIVQ